MPNLFEMIDANDITALDKKMKELRDLAEESATNDDEKIPAEFRAKNTDGETLLHVAVRKKSLLLLQLLQDRGVPLLLAVAGSNPILVKDNKGNTLLHTAVEIGSFEMVQELLAQDFPTNEKNVAQFTPLQIAEQRAVASDTYSLIAALLRTRQAWQNEAAGFRFNKVVHLIKNAFPSVNPAHGQDKCLLIGRTGSGKSTLLNYVNGARYELKVELDSGKNYAECVENQDKAVAAVGMGMISQTLYPQVITKPGLNFVYCDLAGLFDSRGDEERICAASSVQILSRLPGKIKSIVVVLDLPSFQPRGDAFKKTALALADIIQKKPELMESVYFVITHVEKNLLPTIKAEAILKHMFVL